MSGENEEKCLNYHLEYVRLPYSDITGDRMRPHGGVRRQAACNHPEYQNSGRHILSPLKCEGDLARKCEILSIRTRFTSD